MGYIFLMYKIVKTVKQISGKSSFIFYIGNYGWQPGVLSSRCLVRIYIDTMKTSCLLPLCVGNCLTSRSILGPLSTSLCRD